MTLFGDLSKIYDKAQQLPMLPTLLLMKGADKAGKLVKQHTFLGKTVKDAKTQKNKHIWRGSRYLRKHVLEASIKNVDQQSGGALKSLRNSYESFQSWGKRLEERNVLTAQRPSPQAIHKLAERFRNNAASDADKAKMDDLNLRFDPATKTLVAKKPLSQAAILERLGETASSQDGQKILAALENKTFGPEDHAVLKAFGLKAYPDGTIESTTEPPLNPLEKKLCVYFDEALSTKPQVHMEDIDQEALKLNLRTLRAKQFDKLDNAMMDVLAELHLKVEDGVLVDVTPKALASSGEQQPASKALPLSPIERSLVDKMKAVDNQQDSKALLDRIQTGQLSEDDTQLLDTLNFKVLADKTLVDLETDKLEKKEIQLYRLLDPKDQDAITYLHEMKNATLKEQFGYIRNRQFDKLDSRIRLNLNNLNISIDPESGHILDPKNNLNKYTQDAINL